MKKWIGFQTAGRLLILFFGLLAVFHLLVFLGVLSSNLVWGGQATGSTENLRQLEFFSLIFSLLFALIVTAKIHPPEVATAKRLIRVLMWLVFAYLLVNIAGNLTSPSTWERIIFTPLTLVAAFLALRLAIEK